MKSWLKIAFVIGFLVESLGCAGSSTSPSVSPADAFLGTGSNAGTYWPTAGWRTCRPEAVGMDSEGLKQVYEYAANPNINTEGIIIIKDGYIVGEAYFGDFTRSSRHDSWSLAKSVSSALIGIALDRGWIGSVNDEIFHYFPRWQTADTPEVNRRVTLRHLLTMTGGLEWREEDYYGDTSQEDIFRMYREADDFIQYVLAKPVVVEPGTRWYYSSGESMLLSGILESATGERAFAFAREHLFNPLGISNVNWESDPAGHTITGWGISATVRDYAKFGYLYLSEGQWEVRQIVSISWVRESTRAFSNKTTHFGYLWWLLHAYDSYREIGVTEGTFMASGAFSQCIIVVPENNLVVVRVGNDVPTEDLEWRTSEFIRLIQASLLE